jgi:hypothetical protein
LLTAERRKEISAAGVNARSRRLPRGIADTEEDEAAGVEADRIASILFEAEQAAQLASFERALAADAGSAGSDSALECPTVQAGPLHPRHPHSVGGPNECIEANPSSQTVKLGGKFINLSAISRTQGIDQSYLSRIFARKRDPSLKCARKIAACLGMGLEAFLEALDGKQKEKGRPRG